MNRGMKRGIARRENSIVALPLLEEISCLSEARLLENVSFLRDRFSIIEWKRHKILGFN
jgi:hypothetical protein